MKRHRKQHTPVDHRLSNLRQFQAGTATVSSGARGAGGPSPGISTAVAELQGDGAAEPAPPGGRQWCRFECDGRGYALYRHANGIWRSSFAIRGVRYHRSLDTTVKAVAIRRAIDWIIRPARQAKWGAGIGAMVRPESRPEPTSTVMVSKVIELYEAAALGLPRTIRNNCWALKRVLRGVLGEAEDWRLDQINAELAHAFQRKLVEEAVSGRLSIVRTDPLEDEALARGRGLRSSYSILVQARSLFVPAMLERYRAAGLRIPAGVIEFHGARLNHGPAAPRSPVDDAVCRRTFKEVARFRRSDPNVFRAFWLAVGAGLRLGEIARFQRADLKRVGGRWAVAGGMGKDGQPILVFLQDRAVKELGLKAAKAGATAGTRFFLDGSEQERSSAVPRRLNAWLRSLGWRNQKVMHDLRAWVGSKLYERDPKAAQVFLRHKRLTTTEGHYAHHARAGKVPNVI